MKIKTTVTEIECTVDELRQSNSLSEGFLNILRNCFNGSAPTVTEEEIAEEMAKEQAGGNDD